MRISEAGEVAPLAVESLGERYRRYRLPDADGDRAMLQSLRRYGQLAPIVVCVQEGIEVLDGFKRVSAARTLTWKTLSSRLLEVDERTAKAAIYGLNRVGRTTRELEEAWIVWALVREDGLTQVETAELMGRHKSWVCRRLALLEKLSVEALEDLRVGLLPPTAARSLTQLPAGNQAEVLSAARREGLSNVELRGVVELLLGTANKAQAEFVLQQPREALRQLQRSSRKGIDPRLSLFGNRLSRQLGMLLDLLSQMETWLHHRGRVDLSRGDCEVLTPSFERLAKSARTVSELAGDLAEEAR